jgi:hypothetical protein
MDAGGDEGFAVEEEARRQKGLLTIVRSQKAARRERSASFLLLTSYFLLLTSYFLLLTSGFWLLASGFY